MRPVRRAVLDADVAASHTFRVAPPSPCDAFPQSFVWGTANAAHQVEGGNWNTDRWAWEQTPGTPCREQSGDACDHYQRYPDALALLAGLSFNSTSNSQA